MPPAGIFCVLSGQTEYVQYGKINRGRVWTTSYIIYTNQGVEQFILCGRINLQCDFEYSAVYIYYINAIGEIVNSRINSFPYKYTL